MTPTPQIWLQGIGLIGQLLFTIRTVHQWVASEKAHRSVVPPSFWLLSIVGNLLLCVYGGSTGNPVFLTGPVVNLLVAVRLCLLARRPSSGPRPRSWLVASAAAMAGVLVVISLAAVIRDRHEGDSLWGPWLVAGLLGQSLWSGRFLMQWWESERHGEAGLSATFFAFSALGAVLLACYALHVGDLVFILAYALAPVPYVRNLVLIARHGRARRPVVATRPVPSESG